MKTYKVTIPDMSEISVGDIVEFNGVEHECVQGSNCSYCSLLNKCDSMARWCPIRSHFQLVKPNKE